VLSPMAPNQPVTPDYQLIQGPWYHVTAGDGLDYHGLDLNGVELAWFDHWLKGVDTGITDTTTPLHLEDLATGKYEDVSRYPLNQATPTTYYMQPSAALSTSEPKATSSTDELIWDGSEIPCTTSTEQWAAGLGVFALSYLGISDPCTKNSAPSQIGPGTQSYTTAPFKQATTLAGPIGATLYATSTTTDTEWVVQVSDVAPDGTSTPLTSGLLEGNQRALNTSLSWDAPDGKPLLPYHPYTQPAQTPVVPGKVTRYDVEVFPTYDTLEPGHRLRITIATSDFPHALPEAVQLPDLIGGVYQLEHTAAYPSSVELPLISSQSQQSVPVAPKTPLGCPAASGRLSGNVLGPARLGMTRAQVRKAFPDNSTSSTRGRAYMDFFCLSQSGIRVGFPSASLLRSLPRSERSKLNGHVILALTANRAYALRGVHVGASLSAAARRLGPGPAYKVGLNTWYLTPNGSSRGVLKVRQGKIEEIGIASKQLTGSPAAIRHFLRGFY
jgi:hypothetical protein